MACGYDERAGRVRACPTRPSSPHPVCSRFALGRHTTPVAHQLKCSCSEAPRDTPIAEAPVDAVYAIGNGYTQSKWVAEQLLLATAQRTTLDPLIVRVGQLTGGPWVLCRRSTGMSCILPSDLGY